MMDNLNPQQLQAVEDDSKAKMVIAGPGTGKTKTLVAKIIFLIQEKKVPSSKILALTFTHKAATEMLDRCKASLSSEELPTITTFHGLAARILQRQKVQINIVDHLAQTKIFQNLLTEKKFIEIAKLSIREIALKVSRIKNQAESGDELWQEFVSQYNLRLSEQGLLDYDDLLIKAWEITKGDSTSSNTDFVGDPLSSPRKWGSPTAGGYGDDDYIYILVDEWQDTNQLQYEFLQSLISDHTKVMVIGDPKQSIYTFRGANEQIFRRFAKDFPDTKTIHLTENYRSTADILSFSQQLFPNEPQLVANQQQSGSIVHLQTLDRSTEAHWVVADIQHKIGGADLNMVNSQAEDDKLTFNKFAILYRTHAIRTKIEKYLFSSGLPFQVIGQDHLLIRPHITHLIKILRYLSTDQSSLELSEDDKKLIEEIKHFQPLQLMKVLELIINSNQFVNYVKDSQKQLDFWHLQSLANQFAEAKNSIAQFIQWNDKQAAQDFFDAKAEKIVVMTMHAAKGLEFDTVYICGLEEGILPLVRKGKKIEPDQLDEERRILYVALTRAKRNLVLLSTTLSKTRHSPLWFELQSGPVKLIKDESASKVIKKRDKIREQKRQLTMF